MPQNTNATQPRTVQAADRGKLDVRALVLLAILLAAGFILNFTVGKAISGISGGMISPEFIISAFCLTILVVRPNIGQALVIGLISAAVIQITTTSPFIDLPPRASPPCLWPPSSTLPARTAKLSLSSPLSPPS